MTQLLSITEVAARLSCSRGHVYTLIAIGAFRPVEIGASHRPKTRVRKEEVEAFVEARTRVVS